MVQVLPYVPSFGERLAPVLAEAGSNIAQGLDRRNAMTALQKILAPQQASQGVPGHISTAMNGAGGMQQTSQPASPFQALQIYSLAEKAYGPEGAKQLTNSYLQQQKLTEKEAQEVRKEQRTEERDLAKAENLPFFEKLAADRESLPAAMQSNEQVIDAILKGNVGPGSLPHLGRIAADLGVPASITKMLESTDSKEFNNGIKGLMGHTIKDTFRGTTTQREIDIAEAMQAEIGVRPEANLAAAWAVQSDLLIRQEKLRLAQDLQEQGIARAKIPAIVEKQLEPYRKQLKDQYFEAIQELRKKK